MCAPCPASALVCSPAPPPPPPPLLPSPPHTHQVKKAPPIEPSSSSARNQEDIAIGKLRGEDYNFEFQGKVKDGKMHFRLFMTQVRAYIPVVYVYIYVCVRERERAGTGMCVCATSCCWVGLGPARCGPVDLCGYRGVIQHWVKGEGQALWPSVQCRRWPRMHCGSLHGCIHACALLIAHGLCVVCCSCCAVTVCVSLKLQVSDNSDGANHSVVRTIDFVFDPDVDTADNLAAEISEEFSLSPTDTEICAAALRELLAKDMPGSDSK